MTSEELADILLTNDISMYEVAQAIELAYRGYMRREFEYASIEYLKDNSETLAFYMSALNYARI